MSFGDDTLDPDNNKPETVKRPRYYQQIPLDPKVAEIQAQCNHTLEIPMTGIIRCGNCNAMWVK